jgi:hypothetical protein
MVQLNEKKVSLRLLGLFLIWGLLASAVGALESGENGLGLILPSPEQREWEKKNMRVAQEIRFNSLGQARIDEFREKSGQDPLPSTYLAPADFGSEISGPIEEDLPIYIAPMEPSALGDLPASVDNSTLNYFPPIRSQGSLGSCGQWSGMYYVYTHMTAMARNWNAKTGGDAYRISPKFTYNLINKGTNTGSWYTDGWRIAQKHGVATWAERPYDSDFRSWPLTASVWRNALANKADSYGWVYDVDLPSGMDNLKSLLVNGYVLSFATYINSWQFKPAGNDSSTSEDDAFAGKPVSYWVNGTAGFHAMTIVGYNDTVWVDINGNGSVDSGEKGALRIANSWGTGYREGGFTWLAYDALKLTSGVAGGPSSNRGKAIYGAHVSWVIPRVSYTPKALAEFTLSHAQRNQLRVSLGVSDTSQTTPSTLWSPSYLLDMAGGAYAFNGSATAVDGTFVFDFSDLVPVFGTPKRYYLNVTDTVTGNAGALKSFKWVNVPDSAEVARSGLPDTVDGATKRYSVDATVADGAGGTPPTISDIANQTFNEDGTSGSLAFTVGDAETPPGSLTVSVTGSNPGLVSTDGVVLGGSNANRTLTITPIANAYGSATITVRVTDPSGQTGEDTLTLTVNSVNDRPVASTGSLIVTQGVARALTLSGSDVEGTPLTYAVTVPPTHGTLSGTAPALTYTPTPGYTGNDSLSFTVSDGALTSVPAVVSITVIPSDNTPPLVSFTAPSDGGTVSGAVTVSVNASDVVGVSRVVFAVDGVSMSTDTSLPYSFLWQVEGKRGTLALRATAYDLAENSAFAQINVQVGEGGITFSVSPTTLDFEGFAGGENPPPSAVDVMAVAQGPGNAWVVTENIPWLTVTPSSGSGPGQFSVSGNLASLPVGTYSGTILVNSAIQSQSITVQLTVNPADDDTPPTVPTGLSGILASTTSVALTWQASSDNAGGAGLLGYRVFRDNALIGEPVALSLVDGDPIPGARHHYEVSARDSAGNESARCAAVMVLIPAEVDAQTEAYSFPNPAQRGTPPTIRAVLGTVDALEISIYDVAGRLVHSQQLPPIPAGNTVDRAYYDFSWTGDIPSGRYTVIVHGSGANGSVRRKTIVTVVR